MAAPQIHAADKIGQIAYDGSIAVSLHSLLYHDSNDAKPAGSQADTTVADLNERQFAKRFAGVAMEAKTATDPAGVIAVAKDIELTIDCASAAFEVGEMVGPIETGAGTALENLKVQKVTDASKAIGVVTARSGTATRVRCRLISRAGQRPNIAPFERGLTGTGVNTETLSGTKTLVDYDAPVQKLDPGGGARDLVLPAVALSEGLTFWIVNTADAAEVITIKGPGGTPANLGTPTQNEGAICICAGGAWTCLVGAIT